jgi:hypothetical protein
MGGKQSFRTRRDTGSEFKIFAANAVALGWEIAGDHRCQRFDIVRRSM